MDPAPLDLWRAAVAGQAARPFLTYYDDATGERVELSFATTENWVAKTANLIVDEIGAEPGERIAIDLPTHWQTVVWYLACWSAGLVAAPGADPAGCDHAVAGPSTIEATLGCRGARVLVPMRPFGAPAVSVPAGVLDFAAEVAAAGDRFVAAAPIDGALAALERDGAGRTGAEVVASARAAAAAWDLTRASRVLSAADLGSATGLCAGLLGPLAVGASVVLCRNLDEANAPTRMATERVTVRLPYPDGRGGSVL